MSEQTPTQPQPSDSVPAGTHYESATDDMQRAAKELLAFVTSPECPASVPGNEATDEAVRVMAGHIAGDRMFARVFTILSINLQRNYY